MRHVRHNSVVGGRRDVRTWSYTLRSAGAILFVNVPATIMLEYGRVVSAQRERQNDP